MKMILEILEYLSMKFGMFIHFLYLIYEKIRPNFWTNVIAVTIFLLIILRGTLRNVYKMLFLKTRKDKKKVLPDSNFDIRDYDWNPKPLVNELSELDKLNLRTPIIEKCLSPLHVISEGKDRMHLGRCNFLGLLGHEKTLTASETALRKYGCGSCGPRGFYGTMDVHLELEKKLAEFLHVSGLCHFPSAIVACPSVIPAFVAPIDFIVCDEDVRYCIRLGNELARCKVFYFKHNDMEELENICIKINKMAKALTKKFIVVEGIGFDTGGLLDLPGIMKIRNKYKFRLFLDDGVGVGVLGEHGRGICEHFDIDPKAIDFLIGNLENSFGSGGGFCSGTPSMLFQQRLQAFGYTFSASAPPFFAASACAAIDLVKEKSEFLLRDLRMNVSQLYDGLRRIRNLNIISDPISPIIYLELADQRPSILEQEKILQAIVEEAFEKGLIINRAKYSTLLEIRPRPRIRVCTSSAMQLKDVMFAIGTIKAATYKIFSSLYLSPRKNLSSPRKYLSPTK